MITLLFIILTGFFNAIMDTLSFHFSNSIFKKWTNKSWINPVLAWRNKWKNGDPKQGERFFGSSTFLVWTTDLWHFIKFLFITSITLSIVFYKEIYNPIFDLILFYLIITTTFELFWRLFKR